MPASPASPASPAPPSDIHVRLPDGTLKSYPAPATGRDVAASIGEGLAKAAVGVKVNGRLHDLDRPLPAAPPKPASPAGSEPLDLAIVTRPRADKQGRSKGEPDPDALYLLRHSAAHVMAEAIQRLRPDALLAYGPPVEQGFYYDIALDPPLSSDDFPKIEQLMRQIVQESRPFSRYELDPEEGLNKLRQENNKYKLDNAQRAIDAGADRLSWYVTGDAASGQAASGEADTGQGAKGSRDQGEATESVNASPPSATGPMGPSAPSFEDLCQGPHLPTTADIGAFKVTSVASSHWRGDVHSDRFQRVYGTAFFTPADLEHHLEQLEQAKQRDHRVLGTKLGLFAIDDMVGQGLILWKPKGAVIRDELQKFIMEHLRRQGYSQVFTPHIGKLELYKTSGHFPYYQDSQYPPLILRDQVEALADEGCTCGDLANLMKQGDIDGYLLKPMNCPHHIKIYSSEKRSYRDLPIRLAEFGTVYRWEQSGELAGLTRVRGFTQDDAHLFVTQEQLNDEVMGCIELVKIVFSTLGMTDYRVRVGLRDPRSDKYAGDPAQWEKAQAACGLAAESLGVPFTKEPGEAAFYGPKIDFVVKDVIGREWQLGTVQVDYQLPQRFDLSYTGSDNTEHRPVMIHRAPFGSMERFIGVLIEHFNAEFPLWLSPEQVRVLPISDKFNGYASQVAAALRDAGIRVSVDDSNERLGGKIRDAELNKLPYMLVVGGKDEAAGTVSVRHRTRGDEGATPLEAFIERVKTQVAERTV